MLVIWLFLYTISADICQIQLFLRHLKWLYYANSLERCSFCIDSSNSLGISCHSSKSLFKRIFSLLVPSTRYETSSLVFTWDASFNALLMSLEDIEFAQEMILNLIKINFDKSSGRMNHVNIVGQNLDCSNPPVTAYCSWKIYLKSKWN